MAISNSSLREGITKSFDNADRYFKDATLLNKNNAFESSILLAMLSFEESGKTMMLIDYFKQHKTLTSKIWKKDFCNHVTKNLACHKLLWQRNGSPQGFEDEQKDTSKFQFDWKNAFTYVGFDFHNKEWDSPLSPESFMKGNVLYFSSAALSQARQALDLAKEQLATLDV